MGIVIVTETRSLGRDGKNVEGKSVADVLLKVNNEHCMQGHKVVVHGT